MRKGAGSLDHFITIQAKTITQNSIGEETVTYSNYAQMWAAKRYKSGVESLDAGRIVSEDRVTFTIRHIDGLDTSMRLVDGSETYDILFVKLSDERRVWIELECKLVL